MQRLILVVDDDPASASYMGLALRERFAKVTTVASAPDALRSIQEERPALVVSDLKMPGMDGLALLDRIRECWPSIPVILVTVDDEIATIVEAVKRGATNYLVKPVPPERLRAAAEQALRTANLSEEAAENAVPEFVGISAAASDIRRLITLSARSDVNVLITGETGTGKELVAHAIHRLSSLRSGPFVSHNCAVTPTELFESHFFGHRRGAFTGAERDHVGLLEAADGGILFLDELECMSVAHQAKLLRVLDNGEFEQVGSNRARSVAVRFISATNREPAFLLEEQALREDLYYRLRGIEIHIPPLRERAEDISPLAAHFLGLSGAELSSDALAELVRQPWKGNARQLRNTLRSAIVLSEGAIIRPRHLAYHLAPEGRQDLPAARVQRDAGAASSSSALEQLEREAILNALRVSGGNRSLAAKALGIHRTTLLRKLRHYGSDP